MKKLIIIILCAVLSGTALAAAIYGITEKMNPDTPLSELSLPSSQNDTKGVTLTELLAFTGEYWEKGAVKQVKDVAAVKIKNTTSLNFRFAEIQVVTKTQTYKFLATSLLSGEEMMIPEMDEKTLPRDFEFVSAQITSCELFEEALTLLPKQLKISGDNKQITLENIGGEDIEGKINVYMKLRDGDSTVSGITFKAHVIGLKKGEKKTLELSLDTAYSLTPVFSEIV